MPRTMAWLGARRKGSGSGSAFLASLDPAPYNGTVRNSASKMIITCPACSTRYLVDPRSLGAAGRTVRCTNCSHTWMQTPPDDAPRRVDLPPTESPFPASPPLESAAYRPQSTPRSGIILPVTILVILVIVVGLLWAERQQIAAQWPGAARYYGMLGLSVGDPHNDLELRQVSSNREEGNGHSTLMIHGEVANISQGARAVPKLKVTLQDSNKHPLKSWAIAVTPDRLSAGAAVPFQTSVVDPADNAAGVVVTFDWGND